MGYHSKIYGMIFTHSFLQDTVKIVWDGLIQSTNSHNTYKGYWPIIAHLFGHQRGKNKEEELSQVHKSGYTLEHLTNVLVGLGYKDITEEPPKRATPHSPVIRLRSYKY